MLVYKKSDVQEEFSADKLARSILSANSETEETIDINLIMAEFRSIVIDKEDITSGEISVIVYGLLYSKGAVQTLEKYAEHKKQ